MSCRMEFCQMVSRHKNVAATTVTTTVVIRLLTYCNRSRGCGISMYSQIHTNKTPTPYPTASENPDRIPCTRKFRGSSDGVSDAAKNNVATARPINENDDQNRAAIDF